MDEAAKNNRNASAGLELVRLTPDLGWICQHKLISSDRKNLQLLLGLFVFKMKR